MGIQALAIPFASPLEGDGKGFQRASNKSSKVHVTRSQEILTPVWEPRVAHAEEKALLLEIPESQIHQP